MATKVQMHLMQLHIKYQPIKPGSPYLNGKVERVQQTILMELYSITDVKNENLAEELGVWLMYYNYQRVHGSVGTSPIEKLCQRIYDTPSSEEVFDDYEPTKERFQERDYRIDQLFSQTRR